MPKKQLPSSRPLDIERVIKLSKLSNETLWDQIPESGRWTTSPSERCEELAASLLPANGLK